MIIIGTILFFARNQIVDAISVLGGADNAKRFVANADTAFKVFQTIIFLPFASQFVKLTKLLIPGNKEGEDYILNISERHQASLCHLQP